LQVAQRQLRGVSSSWLRQIFFVSSIFCEIIKQMNIIIEGNPFLFSLVPTVAGVL